jgi:formiminotetrahydrofolate cyclodeaminase
MDFERYLDALASAEPTPGGGSAAALVGALGAALCAMVARITLGSSKHTAAHAAAETVAADADALRARFLTLRLRDEDAFRAVVDAQSAPRATAEERGERTKRLQAALAGAAEAPLEAAQACSDLLALVSWTAELRNAHLMSDVTCALHFGRAALDASVANVAVNHAYITDASIVGAQAGRLAAISVEAAAFAERAEALIAGD